MLDDDIAGAENLSGFLANYVSSEVPGMQYLVVGADKILFEYAGGWADIRGQQAMTPATTMMAYSMTKTVTAVAVLQLVERQMIGLDDLIDRYLPTIPYRGRGITIRQLLDHTSGVPSPIPLRWVHLVEDHARFDESGALAAVLHEYPRLAFEPGRRFIYSNIGYWLLGRLIEQVVGQSYRTYVKTNIIERLGLPEHEMDFVIPDPSRHASGYLAKYSWLNLLKGLFIDRKFVGGYEGRWLRLNAHYLDGPAFGGLIGSARAFSRLLQDQLCERSVLLSGESRRLLETRQEDNAGRPIPMTLGWHVAEKFGTTCLFKEGGGGGFHGEMRIYPAKGLGSVVLANATGFDSTRFLDRVDRTSIDGRP